MIRSLSTLRLRLWGWRDMKENDISRAQELLTDLRHARWFLWNTRFLSIQKIWTDNKIFFLKLKKREAERILSERIYNITNELDTLGVEYEGKGSHKYIEHDLDKIEKRAIKEGFNKELVKDILYGIERKNQV